MTRERGWGACANQPPYPPMPVSAIGTRRSHLRHSPTWCTFQAPVWPALALVGAVYGPPGPYHFGGRGRLGQRRERSAVIADKPAGEHTKIDAILVNRLRWVNCPAAEVVVP